MNITLFDGQSANGNSAFVGLPHTPHGRYLVLAEGTWGGGTLTLQAAADEAGANAAPLSVSFTADGASILEAGAGMYVRASLTGATGPDLNCVIVPLGSY